MSDTVYAVIGGVVAVALAAAAVVMFGSRSSTSSSSSTAAAATKKDAASENGSASKYPAGKLAVVFGSQTGTAEGFAKVLSGEGKAHGFDAAPYDLEDFTPDELQSIDRAIFLMATYGEGEPTDNAAKFYKWMRGEVDDVPEGFLSNTKYTVFGLGNRQYDHYNAMGRITNEVLEKYGATRVYEYGEGDDDGTLEEDFEEWKKNLWPALLMDACPDPETRTRLDSQSEGAPLRMPDLEFDLVLLDEYEGRVSENIPPAQMNSSTKFYFTSPSVAVVANRELRSEMDDGSTRHIEFDLRGSDLSYFTADNLSVLPENNDEVVEAVALAMGYDLDQHFTFKPKEGENFKFPFPVPCTVRTALQRYCDLQSIPRRGLLNSLLPFNMSDEQRALLERLCAPDGRAYYTDVVEKAKRSFAGILCNELSSIEIPLEHFLRLVPALQPRAYTISSSSHVSPSVVHITVSLTAEPLPTGGKFHGVCSSYLLRLRSGIDTCRVFVRESSFRLPRDPATPVIMVGPGTGIAPMRALLQERRFQRTVQNAPVGENVLFFGCKNRELDFIYRDELEQFQDDGTLTTLHLAFSREQAHKVYVQHLMRRPEIVEQLAELLFKQGAHVYVCGATQMGHDVQKAIIDIIGEAQNLSTEKATKVFESLQSSGRYIQELWS